jgi:hypothetical protein
MTRCAERALNAPAVWPDVAFGTERTNRAGLAMSVVRGGPEVLGTWSKRRFSPM